MLLLTIDSEWGPADVEGELMGDTSLGDKESMLSTPLSASDIAAGTRSVCGMVEKVDLEGTLELEEGNEEEG